ncbi:MAG: S1/P1 nuclease [Alistipes sp.]|nr:S1/P1 nuclease [Alistipes sp.]
MKIKVTILTLALALMASYEVSAWGRLGHRTIAEIAERHLTPQAKANIEKYTHGTPLADYSLWMDEVRNTPEYKKPTSGWHASIVDEKCHTSQELRNKHRKGRDSVTGIIDLSELLKNRQELSDSTVMFAIKCLVHMVGDFHCPSHLRYTDFANKGHQKITYLGRETTLHKAWDTGIIAYNHKKWSYQRYADKLDCYTKKQIKAVTKGDVERWMEDAARDVRPSIHWVKDGDVLGEEFTKKALPLAEQQIQKAGYQLAKVLNTLFK